MPRGGLTAELKAGFERQMLEASSKASFKAAVKQFCGGKKEQTGGTPSLEVAASRSAKASAPTSEATCPLASSATLASSAAFITAASREQKASSEDPSHSPQPSH
mgnify:CR=1 FL=1